MKTKIVKIRDRSQKKIEQGVGLVDWYKLKQSRLG